MVYKQITSVLEECYCQEKKICFPTDTLIPLWLSLVFCSDLLSCWGSPVEGAQVGRPDLSSQVIWLQMNLPPLLFESSRQVVLSFSSDHIPAFDIAASNWNLIWTFILSSALTSLKIRVQLDIINFHNTVSIYGLVHQIFDWIPMTSFRFLKQFGFPPSFFFIYASLSESLFC